jgi:transglutaminase-like putative cysteine protease
MLLSVRHETNYCYEKAANLVSQLLRLTPRPHEGQAVLDWRVTRSDGAPVASFTDGLGNICGFVGRRGPIPAVSISVVGRVRTSDVGGRVRGALEPLPPGYYLRATEPTSPTVKVLAFAEAAIGKAKGRKALEALLAAVRERLAPAAASDQAEPSATAALDAGRGVPADYAHLFVAAARTAGAPARFVGGYLWRGPADARAGEDLFTLHSWAEVWTPDEGWLGFDPSRGETIGEGHIRVSVGLDYRQASPICGLWRGQGRESMTMAGAVEAVESGQ